MLIPIVIEIQWHFYLWKYLYNDKNNALSAGRCQTPALRLVYDNEQQIQNAQTSSPIYKIHGNFLTEKMDFVLKQEFESIEETEQFMKKSVHHKYKLISRSIQIRLYSIFRYIHYFLIRPFDLAND